MSQTDCRHLDVEGTCKGLYEGFGCIEHKCKDPTAGPAVDQCVNVRGDGYCIKLGKFHCPGPEDCKDFKTV